MKQVRDFLKTQDQLGKGVSLNYRGSPKFGTITGGFFSLIVRLFITSFVILQIAAWCLETSYKEQH